MSTKGWLSALGCFGFLALAILAAGYWAVRVTEIRDRQRAEEDRLRRESAPAMRTASVPPPIVPPRPAAGALPPVSPSPAVQGLPSAPPPLARLEEARFHDLSVSVDDVHVTGSCPGEQEGLSAEGAVFVIVYLTARNVGEDAVDVPRFEYELGRYRPGLGSGRTCRYDSQAFRTACRRNGGRLFPGARCDGWVLFEVPRAFDTSQHNVKVTARFGSGKPDTAEWLLKR